MKQYLLIAQGVVSIFLIISILLQQRSSSLGSAFGGTGEFHGTRRGAEKKLFGVTIILSILFVVLALLNLIIN
ncbi:MAG: preprotein translocase subunit SecG [Patescibacteria group bacterium]|nr:preprotein translocase subunit SecG [Patescibacteria group bacterium]